MSDSLTGSNSAHGAGGSSGGGLLMTQTPSSSSSSPQLLKQLTSPPPTPILTASTSLSSGSTYGSSPIGRPSSPVRKKLKLDIDAANGSVGRNEDGKGIVNCNDGNMSLVERRAKLFEKRKHRLENASRAYKDNFAELYFLQSSGNLVDFPTFKKKPTLQYLDFLKLNNAPPKIIEEIKSVLPVIVPHSSSLNSGGGPSPISVQKNHPLSIITSSNITNTTPKTSTVSSSHLPPPSKVPTTPSSKSSSSSSTTTTLPPCSVTPPPLVCLPPNARQSPSSVKTNLDSRLSSSNPTHTPRPSLYHPRLTGTLSPVKYGEHLSTNIPTTCTPTISRNMTQYTRQQLSDKMKQEVWVTRRVQELIKEGLWSSKRLPKIVEKARPKSHWDSLLSEMQWLSVDFYQERKWKKAAAKMLAYSAKEYVHNLEEKRRKAKLEEEARLKRIASFAAKEIRSFWRNISTMSELKIARSQRVLSRRMLQQQLSYVLEEQQQQNKTINRQISRRRNNSRDNNNKNIDLLLLNGSDPGTSTSSSTDKLDSDDDFDDETSIIDDESTICEQELYEANNRELNALELRKLDEDSLRPLNQLLQTEYPGVLSEYLDLYEELIESSSSSSCSEEEDDLYDDEDIGVHCLEEKRNDDIIHSELSIDSLINSSSSIEKHSTTTTTTTKRRDILDLAREAESCIKIQSAAALSSLPALPLFKGKLREYQIIGLNWLISMHRNRLNSALADEAGLGRKIQIIAFLSWLLLNPSTSSSSQIYPHLLIVPISQLSAWMTAIQEWCPALTTLEYGGSTRTRKTLRKAWNNNNESTGEGIKVVLTSYRVMFQDATHFTRRRWNYLILGEAQNLIHVTPDAITSLFDLKCQRRLNVLSKALPSNPIDLWNLLYLLQPKTYFLYQEYNVNQTLVERTSEFDEAVKKLHGVLNPFILRRTRSSLEKQLPSIDEIIHKLEMSPRQRRLYDDYLASPKAQNCISKGDLDSVSSVLCSLRKICDHPLLLLRDEPTTELISSSSIILPRICVETPSLVTNAIEYSPFKNIDLNALNFVFFTHETTLTVIISDRIRKSCAPKNLIEELPTSTPLNQRVPSIPSGRLNLEFQSNTNVGRPISSQLVQTASGQHILLSTQIVKKPKQSTTSNNTLVSSSSAESRNSLGAFHKESLRVIATFNQRRCMGLPLYGKDLVDMLTIVTSLRPCRSMFKGQGLVNCLGSFPNAKDKDQFRYQTKSLKSMVNLTTSKISQIHSDSTTIFGLICFTPPIQLTNFHQNNSLSTHVLQTNLNRVYKDHHQQQQQLSLMSYRVPSRAKLMLWANPSVKLDALQRILKTNNGSNILIFCEILEMRELLIQFFRQHYYDFVAIEPDSSLQDKLEALHLFTLSSNTCNILLTSALTSPVGISGLKFDHAVFYDSNWAESKYHYNPWIELASRNNSITIHRLICKGSLEDNISRKNIQRKLLTDLKLDNNGTSTAEILKISKGTLEDLFYRCDNGTRKRRLTPVDLSPNNLDKESKRKEKSRIGSKEIVEFDDVEIDDRDAISTLDWIWSSVSSVDLMESIVVDLAELDSGCVQTSLIDEDHPSVLEVDTHQIFDNLKPIERYGLIQYKDPESYLRTPEIHRDIIHEKKNALDDKKWLWEQLHQTKISEIEAEVEKLENLPLLTYSSEDAGRSWYGGNGQPMPLWPAPSPASAGTCMVPPLDGLNNDLASIEHSLSFWYKTDRLMDESELPPIYIKKDPTTNSSSGLKRSASEAGLGDNISSSNVNSTSTPSDIKHKFRKDHESNSHTSTAPKSLFDRPSPALLKARRDFKKIYRSQGGGPPSLPPTTTAAPTINSPAPVAGLRTPLPRQQVEADPQPEWLIQEDWALLSAVRDLLELPLNLTVLHPGHTANWDMVADMVNAVSRIYRGPRQCKLRYESIIMPREEGRILVDIPQSIMAVTGATTSPASSVVGSSTSPQGPNNGKKQKKNKAGALKVIPPPKSNRPLKTSQLYYQDNNNKWTTLYKNRFESIKNVANKRTPTAKPLLVNPTHKNPKHAVVLAENSITYDSPLNPITVAQNRAERIQKEKQRSQQLQQQELNQQRIASAQAAANAAQQSAAAQQQQQQRVVAVSSSPQVQQQSAAAAAAAAQAVVVGISQPNAQVARVAAQQQQQVAQQQQLQELVRSSNTVVVTSPSSTVVSLANLGRLQTTQKIVTQGGRPLTPHQVNLLRTQALMKPSAAGSSAGTAGESTAVGKLRMQPGGIIAGTQLVTAAAAGNSATSTGAGGQKVSVSVTPSGTLQATVSGVTSNIAGNSVTVVSQANSIAGKTHQIRQLTTAGGSKGTAIRTMSDQEMKILVAKQQQLNAAAGGKISIPTHSNVAPAHILSQAGFKLQEGAAGGATTATASGAAGTSGSGAPVATFVKTVNALGQPGQSVTIPVQGMNLPQVKAALARSGSSPQMQMKLLQQMQRNKQAGQQQRVALSQNKAGGLQAQLIVQSGSQHQKNIPGSVTVQQILKQVQPGSSIGHAAVLTKQGGSVVNAASTPGSIQARVIPVSAAGGAAGARGQTIQVVAAPGASRGAQNMTIDASGRPTGTVATVSSASLVNALAQGAQIKVAAPNVTNNQQLLSQVSAALGVQPVSIRTTDVSLAVRSTPPVTAKTISTASVAAAQAAAQSSSTPTTTSSTSSSSSGAGTSASK